MKRQTVKRVSIIILIWSALRTIRKLMLALGESEKLANKHLDLYLEAMKWLELKQEGYSISDYISSMGYANIAIYGMSYLGVALVNELLNSKINIAYGIDQEKDCAICKIDMYKPTDKLPPTDCIIITTYGHTEEIVTNIRNSVNCPILLLDELLYEM